MIAGTGLAAEVDRFSFGIAKHLFDSSRRSPVNNVTQRSPRSLRNFRRQYLFSRVDLAL